MIVASPDVRISRLPSMTRSRWRSSATTPTTPPQATPLPAAPTTWAAGCSTPTTTARASSLRRIHFPGAAKDAQIKKLLSRLGRRADEVETEALTAMRSAPFDRPERGRIAVKLITRTGMEMTSVVDLNGAPT